MVPYNQCALPLADSSATQGFNETYISCYNLILEAERNALDTYASTGEELAKQDIISARVTGGFLIHLYSKRRILGDQPANAVVSQVLSGSSPPQTVIYFVGKMLRDRLIYAFRSETTPAVPRSAHPSRPSFIRLEDMLAQSMEASGNDYQTSRKKALARDGYQCMLTGNFDTNSCLRNAELETFVENSGGSEAPVQTCHILNKATMQGIGEPSELDGSETPSTRAHAAGVMATLKQFRLNHLVDELIHEGGVHSLRNLLSLIQPLHEAFDRLDLWFDQTDEDDTYEVQVARDRILTAFTHVNRRPHFTVNEMLKKPKFRNVRLALPDPGLLALHAVCARVAHMSGAAEYFYELERDAEDTMVLTEGSVQLLNNLLSPFTVVSAY
ncbi:hypothetical protein GYMLUDRAFT_236686 [Collybiopsis luxurians FD-317 M1]|nr:hypothetical protein GYMLUDRAFT_236686 [Collybiopsis luxurians FD-317 M1]